MKLHLLLTAKFEKISLVDLITIPRPFP